MSTGADIGWAADPNLRTGEWQATTHFGLRPAPHGLALVEDFLNTGAVPAADLLGDAKQAEDWSTRAARVWSLERGIEPRPPVLADGDDAQLRARVRALVSGICTAAAACGDLGAANFMLSIDGDLHWQPAGDGWRWWAAAICSEVLLSQHSGAWTRLKECRNGSCRVVFYDRSWNNATALHAGDSSPTHRRLANERLPFAATG
ncbi:peptide chain release factor 2 [Mycobacterium montefiorense]|uniref:Uncharacterized protein n=1 Tax=Mycobacterium montefiorense TaxID=154654 RepID=A0AA37PK95_9MYCO|nr:peptide chain release factor 2 [Mycobacterium montefiorense]GBG38706.1 hypothetical protein MmonteBS_30780 [Mycobacterium montefiorense]GKU34534.1 hypothetical protein NJB14191_18800 [Mycobacterium montefiorense]GKU39155.1 hypothetical protein NJB14192_11510 [Mycobacterium montefiorense]GKU43580.1 hypothetical protein NJB14194_02130 [Mycobacterium montefiorense]GKU49920.1 hypothetical protein NJB14195_11660 [Mycobacterium montefiorense]